MSLRGHYREMVGGSQRKCQLYWEGDDWFQSSTGTKTRHMIRGGEEFKGHRKTTSNAAGASPDSGCSEL